jgi:hypothetical protein
MFTRVLQGLAVRYSVYWYPQPDLRLSDYCKDPSDVSCLVSEVSTRLRRHSLPK